MRKDHDKPPEGYELIYSGPWLEGDLYWSGDRWRKSKLRVGGAIPIEDYRRPAARPIQDNKSDKPQTSEDQVW